MTIKFQLVFWRGVEIRGKSGMLLITFCNFGRVYCQIFVVFRRLLDKNRFRLSDQEVQKGAEKYRPLSFGTPQMGRLLNGALGLSRNFGPS